MFQHTCSLMNYLAYIKNIYGSEISWIENNVKLGTSSFLREHTHRNKHGFHCPTPVGLHQTIKS